MLTTEERVISRFVEAGFSSRVSVNTLDEALSVLALHHSVLVSKAEIDDFCEGLQNLQVLESIRNCKDQFKQLFVADENDKLTADRFLEMFTTKHFSEESTTNLSKERQTFMFFRRFLDDSEGRHVFSIVCQCETINAGVIF
jgi:hypothetical protein